MLRCNSIHLLDLLRVDTSRLLDHRMNAMLQCVDSHLRMVVMRNSDDDRIHFAAVYHFSVVIEILDAFIEITFSNFYSLRVDIANGRESHSRDNSIVNPL